MDLDVDVIVKFVIIVIMESLFNWSLYEECTSILIVHF